MFNAVFSRPAASIVEILPWPWPSAPSAHLESNHALFKALGLRSSLGRLLPKALRRPPEIERNLVRKGRMAITLLNCALRRPLRPRPRLPKSTLPTSHLIPVQPVPLLAQRPGWKGGGLLAQGHLDSYLHPTQRESSSRRVTSSSE